MVTNPHIAVITFPGNNCEQETKRAIDNAGMQTEIFLWNRDVKELELFDGFCIPGGFSFEDRGRSGVVAAQSPIFTALKKAAAQGKPILGICNGAQMLVASGLILEDENNTPAVGLLRNKRIDKKGNILGAGYYHSWKHITPQNKKTPFSCFSKTLHIPIAHGEGRFVVPEHLQQKIIENNRIVFTYTDNAGYEDPHYPTNPNGSFTNAAALCNKDGNVVAMMPHPERCEDGNAIFNSLKEYFNAPWECQTSSFPVPVIPEIKPIPLPEKEVTLLVRLKIKDKTEATFASLLHSDFLIRREKWGFIFSESEKADTIKNYIAQIIQSGEVVNTNKEWIVMKIENKWYDWNEKTKEWEKSSARFIEENCFIVQEKEDYKGEATHQHINHSFPKIPIKNVSFGVCWESTKKEKDTLQSHPMMVNKISDVLYHL